MAQYIDKVAVVAEIENRIEKYTKRGEESDAKRDGYGMYWGGVLSCLNEVRSLLDTLEVKDLPIWEKVSPDTGQTTLYKDGDKSYLERFGYRIDLKDLDKLPKKNLKAQKGE